jgi:hypothetical protein
MRWLLTAFLFLLLSDAGGSPYGNVSAALQGVWSSSSGTKGVAGCELAAEFTARTFFFVVTSFGGAVCDNSVAGTFAVTSVTQADLFVSLQQNIGFAAPQVREYPLVLNILNLNATNLSVHVVGVGNPISFFFNGKRKAPSELEGAWSAAVNDGGVPRSDYWFFTSSLARLLSSPFFPRRQCTTVDSSFSTTTTTSVLASETARRFPRSTLSP